MACWTDIHEVTDASEALAELRRQAIAPAPVSVKVSLMEGRGPDHGYVAAAKRAIQLADTELKLQEDEIGKQVPDFEWKIEPVHDDTIVLHSYINRADGVRPQSMRISFINVEEDLPKRIETLIRTRLNRIRYIPPHRPAGLMTGFPLPAETVLRVQHITWTDPAKNQFEPTGKEYKLTVSDPRQPAGGLVEFVRENPMASGSDPDPMSNEAYRVVIVLPERERALFSKLTIALALLMVAAAAVAIYEWTRMRRGPNPAE